MLRLGKNIKIILFNIIIIIILLILSESIVRFLNLSQMQGYKAEIFRDKINRLKPNSKGVVGGIKFFVDKNGLRVPEINYKYKTTNKILFIGDSVTFGVGVAEEESFVGIFRKNLHTSEVYNLSLFGYQIEDYKVQLNELKKFYPIRKIIYFLTLNDVYDHDNVRTVNFIENKYQDGWKKILNLNFLRNINVYLRERSYLFTYLKGVAIDPQASWFANVLSYYKENDLQNLNSFFTKFSNFAFNNKIEAYLFIVPYEFQTRKCDFNSLFPQNKIKELTKEVKINIYDLTSDFCDYSNPKRLFLKYDPMHLSKEGHKFVYNLTNPIINY